MTSKEKTAAINALVACAPPCGTGLVRNATTIIAALQGAKSMKDYAAIARLLAQRDPGLPAQLETYREEIIAILES